MKEELYLFALCNIILHLSMLGPRVGDGGRQADSGEFDIFVEVRVKFPAHRHLLNVKFPPTFSMRVRFW